MGDIALVVIAVNSLGCFFTLSWLCAKLTNIESILSAPFVKDTSVEEAIARLQSGNDKAAVLAFEAARLARITSEQVNVGTELGFQNAARAREVAKNLADTHDRADAESSGVPGAAADAGLRSGQPDR